ncbi:KxYKxGKxW signal peptide domain-containing protein, partial [Fructobacillus fructosus]|nr:KxYKxGKxW signal peptide domain-containing protein [Fructobacillus fructosus]MBD9367028.1 KxYKxGKxW signal peptide domain-containing protein [Leuconostoc mesenteroides]
MEKLHYKMYKDGKFLVFAGIFLVAGAAGVVSDNSIKASASDVNQTTLVVSNNSGEQQTSDAESLNSQKTQAKNNIKSETSKIQKLIDEDSHLDNSQKASQKQALSDTSAQLLGAIEQSDKVQTVQSLQSDGIKKIDAIYQVTVNTLSQNQSSQSDDSSNDKKTNQSDSASDVVTQTGNLSNNVIGSQSVNQSENKNNNSQNTNLGNQLTDDISNKVSDDNSNNVHVGREQFNHISRDVHFQAATGENGADSVDIPADLLPKDVNSFVNYYRYPVYDSNNNLVGYSSDGQHNDIALNDVNQGWRIRSQETELPDVDVPDLSSKGFEVNTNKVTSAYDVNQGFLDTVNGNVDAVKNNYYTADGSAQVVTGPTNNFNSYEHVTITYHYVRTKEYNTSNFYRQIDYVNKNENDGVQAGSHIHASQFDAINYRQIKIYQKGKFLGYSTTNNSLNVDLPTDDAHQGWRLYANLDNENQYLWDWSNGVSPETIPDVKSPKIDGYGDPSIDTVSSNYQIGAPQSDGTGFNNKKDDPNVWISGADGFPNTYEYVKVVYPSANNKVVPETETITRTINYLDRDAYNQNGQKVTDADKVAKTVTQTVTFQRNAVYSADGDLLGYTSGKYGANTPDISIQGGDRAWQLEGTDKWDQVDSPDLSNMGYSAPDRSSIGQYLVKATDKGVVENIFYDSQTIPVGPSNPQVPGQPIDPSNPNGPKWPAGTDKDSVSQTITRTIKYVDGQTGQTVSKDVTEPVTYGRTVIVDKVTGQIVGYSSKGDATADLKPDQGNEAWHSDDNKWHEVTSPDLTKEGYSAPDKSSIAEADVPVNSKDVTEVVTYNHAVVPVGPSNPQVPGQPIDPSNPNGPKWPAGTDKDSVSQTITRTI